MRSYGNHVLALAYAQGERYRGAVLGCVREYLDLRPLPEIISAPRRSPTSAVAAALANALRDYPLDPDIVVWTPDALVRDTISGSLGTTRVPDIAIALHELEEAVARRRGQTACRKLKRNGNLALEIGARWARACMLRDEDPTSVLERG